MSIEFPDFRNNTVEFLEKVGNLVKERLQSHSIGKQKKPPRTLRYTTLDRLVRAKQVGDL